MVGGLGKRPALLGGVDPFQEYCASYRVTVGGLASALVPISESSFIGDRSWQDVASGFVTGPRDFDLPQRATLTSCAIEAGPAAGGVLPDGWPHRAAWGCFTRPII